MEARKAISGQGDFRSVRNFGNLVRTQRQRFELPQSVDDCLVRSLADGFHLLL